LRLLIPPDDGLHDKVPGVGWPMSCDGTKARWPDPLQRHDRQTDRMPRRPLTLLLTGDVMTGRGIDQILPQPVDPVLHEPWVRDARDHVRLAEAAHGAAPRGADCLPSTGADRGRAGG
jgi:hypothetical protein